MTTTQARPYTERELSSWASGFKRGDQVMIDRHHAHERAVRTYMRAGSSEAEARKLAMDSEPPTSLATFDSMGQGYQYITMTDGSRWLWPQLTRMKANADAKTRLYPKDAVVVPADLDLESGRDVRRLADQLELVAKALRSEKIKPSRLPVAARRKIHELDMLELGDEEA